jgi:hypothetical protein
MNRRKDDTGPVRTDIMLNRSTKQCFLANGDDQGQQNDMPYRPAFENALVNPAVISRFLRHKSRNKQIYSDNDCGKPKAPNEKCRMSRKRIHKKWVSMLKKNPYQADNKCSRLCGVQIDQQHTVVDLINRYFSEPNFAYVEFFHS